MSRLTGKRDQSVRTNKMRFFVFLCLSLFPATLALAENANKPFYIISSQVLLRQQLEENRIPKSMGPFWDPTTQEANDAINCLSAYLSRNSPLAEAKINVNISDYKYQIIGVINGEKRFLQIFGICNAKAKEITDLDSTLHLIYSESACYLEAQFDSHSRAIVEFYSEKKF